MDPRADHFALFGLDRGFRLDLSDLDSRYRDVQAQVHPDRFAHAGDAERRLSRLAAWVLDADRQGLVWRLDLPGRDIPLGHGELHRRRALEALALWS